MRARFERQSSNSQSRRPSAGKTELSKQTCSRTRMLRFQWQGVVFAKSPPGAPLWRGDPESTGEPQPDPWSVGDLEYRFFVTVPQLLQSRHHPRDGFPADCGETGGLYDHMLRRMKALWEMCRKPIGDNATKSRRHPSDHVARCVCF